VKNVVVEDRKFLSCDVALRETQGNLQMKWKLPLFSWPLTL